MLLLLGGRKFIIRLTVNLKARFDLITKGLIARLNAS